MGLILAVGIVNYFGPKHSGSVSIWLAIPAIAMVAVIILLAVPHLNIEHLEPRHENLGKTWIAFVGVILALSGVEAIANITGVMKTDPDSTPERPKVTRTATKAIVPVAIEVVVGTALLGWAMLSLPRNLLPELSSHKEDMLRFLADVYGTMALGPGVGQVMSIIVGVVFGLLLLSAVNTAIVAQIGVVYMMAQDGEMPRRLARLNPHGVPLIPLIAAVAIPIVVLSVTKDFEALAGLYAIGVVGAIAVNLGSCTFNKRLDLAWYQRAIMGLTFAILVVVELTIAKTQPEALFFAMCVLAGGYALRAYSHKVSGLKTMTVTRQVADLVTPDLAATMEPRLSEGQKIMVAARGVTPALAFALEEAQLRKATLCVLYVKEIAVYFTGGPTNVGRAKWQDDPAAHAIMTFTMKLGAERGVAVQPVYAVSEDAAATILDLSATLGVDYLIIGASQRTAMAKLLGGSVVTSVAQQLPDSIRLVIFG
jgi:nucleotide-binding universal stress UspA family protein